MILTPKAPIPGRYNVKVDSKSVIVSVTDYGPVAHAVALLKSFPSNPKKFYGLLAAFSDRFLTNVSKPCMFEIQGVNMLVWSKGNTFFVSFPAPPNGKPELAPFAFADGEPEQVQSVTTEHTFALLTGARSVLIMDYGLVAHAVVHVDCDLRNEAESEQFLGALRELYNAHIRKPFLLQMPGQSTLCWSEGPLLSLSASSLPSNYGAAVLLQYLPSLGA